jgi:molybdopterin-guanine dinucleotide biosynthesis protein A
MDAVVIAGGIPQPEESLYPHTRGNPKALLDIAGKPMVQWVLDALGQAQSVDRVVVIGLTDKTGLTCRKPVQYIGSEGKMLANIQAGTTKVKELNPKAEYVLFATSDIPSLTGPMVDWAVNTAMQSKHDIYYSVIPRQVMEERFPTSRRTFVQLKDLEACGGDLHIARAAIVGEHSEFWERLIEARKNPAAQARLLGFDIIFRFLTRQLTAEDVIRRVAQRLGLKGRALMSPFAEIGMDVDKPHQLEILRADLTRQQKARAKATSAGKATSSRVSTSGHKPKRSGGSKSPVRKPGGAKQGTRRQPKKR